VSRLAQLYAAELRGAQPRGPYYLFGYSFGGVVAFEVARELVAQGQRVGLVVMADCPAPGYPKPPPVWERARTHARNLVDGTPTERVRYLRDRVENTVTRMSTWLGFVPHVDIEPVDKVPEHIKHVDAALYEAYNHYQPTPQCVDVLFLTADTAPDWPTAKFDDPLMGWAVALRGRISQCSVPGAHLSIFAPENVPVLVERIQAALRAAERASDDAANWAPSATAASTVKA
jgi:thioesterase domain-containing protein